MNSGLNGMWPTITEAGLVSEERRPQPRLHACSKNPGPVSREPDLSCANPMTGPSDQMARRAPHEVR